jgi:uncharacterized SAM-binding protein YcdF (DUF218 family)
MFIFLSKTLPQLVYPVGLVSILVAVGLLSYRHPNVQRTALILALAVLLVAGNSHVASALFKSLEWRYLPPEEIPHAQVIVVLGGGTNTGHYPRPQADLNSSGDRLVYAAWLYQQGSAPNLLLSSGAIDWLFPDASPTEDMAEILALMGVPREVMWTETRSRNTYENALYSREILEEKGIQRIILVTSASHMRRSVALFEHQGLEVIPAPTDYRISSSELEQLNYPNFAAQIFSLLPSASNLSMTTEAMKEYIGFFVYRLRGWL